MTNKYLEKAAELQEKVDSAIQHHRDAVHHIETPLRELEDGMWDAHNEDRDHSNRDFQVEAQVRSMIDSRVNALRDHLNIDHQLHTNYVNTGNTLLHAGNIHHTVTEHQDGRRILNKIQSVKREHNQYKPLPAFSGMLGALGGGAAGFALGAMKKSPGLAFAAGVGGALAGGFGANKLTHVTVDGKIERRDKQIYDKHEANLHHAYEVLRHQYK